MGLLFGFQTVYPFDYLTSRHDTHSGPYVRAGTGTVVVSGFLLCKFAFFAKIPKPADTRMQMTKFVAGLV